MIEKLIENKYNNYTSNILTKEEIDLAFKNNPFAHYIVYIENNKIIAYLYYSYIYDRIEINNILVEEKYRNKKIASKLLENLVKNYNESITLEVNENNTIAIKLYEKFNFIKKAIRQNYYLDGNGILMEKIRSDENGR